MSPNFYVIRYNPTSFPGSLLFPPPGAGRGETLGTRLAVTVDSCFVTSLLGLVNTPTRCNAQFEMKLPQALAQINCTLTHYMKFPTLNSPVPRITHCRITCSANNALPHHLFPGTRDISTSTKTVFDNFSPAGYHAAALSSAEAPSVEKRRENVGKGKKTWKMRE